MRRSSYEIKKKSSHKTLFDDKVALFESIKLSKYAIVSVHESHKNALRYSIVVLEWIYDKKSLLFNTMDFSHCTNETLLSLFLKS